MDLRQLKQISDLKYQKSEQAIAKLRGRESALRSELSRLQSLAHETHKTPVQDAELRSIGGDVIWLKWLASEQRKLSIELAQVLAQKENLMVQHRTASGKKAVSDALLERSQHKARKDQVKRSLDEAIDASVVRSEFSSPDGRSRQ
ncbi:hypothetical protein [uncultured Tateyamaria sp.]|uniref:hypothetical protein n=1 Tax=uncultured Tateyamaria sp. TaxID=455651 RepID=UPI00262BE7AB|nr:hypothetical protein [uncultured Tateyamaria sp.]